MMTPNWIAEEAIEATLHTGEVLHVRVRIGQPYSASADEWACSVALEGMHDRLRDIHGASSLQALCLATSLARQLLTDFVEDGGSLRYPGRSDEFDIGATFSGVGRPPYPPE